MDRQLIDYLPPVVRNIKEIAAIAEGQQDSVSDLWDAVDDVMNDQFVNDAMENGIRRWEKMLAITPKGTDSLEARRTRIMIRLNERLPFTMRTLTRFLEAICGASQFTLESERDAYRLTVKLLVINHGLYVEVYEMLHRVVPANMIFDLISFYAASEGDRLHLRVNAGVRGMYSYTKGIKAATHPDTIKQPLQCAASTRRIYSFTRAGKKVDHAL